jgi:hypothetical protein
MQDAIIDLRFLRRSLLSGLTSSSIESWVFLNYALSGDFFEWKGFLGVTRSTSYYWVETVSNWDSKMSIILDVWGTVTLSTTDLRSIYDSWRFNLEPVFLFSFINDISKRSWASEFLVVSKLAVVACKCFETWVEI